MAWMVPFHMFAHDQGVMLGDGEAWMRPDENGRPIVMAFNAMPLGLSQVDADQASGAGVTIGGVHIAASRGDDGVTKFQINPPSMKVDFRTQHRRRHISGHHRSHGC